MKERTRGLTFTIPLRHFDITHATFRNDVRVVVTIHKGHRKVQEVLLRHLEMTSRTK